MMQYKGRQQSRESGNATGIPAQLKRRLEESTALKLDDVKVHYRSERPAALDALAYTQGTQVYLGPGQERHLPHELGHVVQQKLGMVRANSRHESGAPLNTDQALERQADRIGAGRERIAGGLLSRRSEPTVQRMSVVEGVAGGRPKVARYKRSGWIALQNLKNYLMEDCIKSIKVENLTQLSDAISAVNVGPAFVQMNRVTKGMEGEIKYQKTFKDSLQREMAAAVVAGASVENWITVARELQEALAQCGEAVMSISEASSSSSEASLPVSEQPVTKLEGSGKYKRVGEADPYYNYKKEALYCIAQKATKLDPGHDAGPHIAISVMNKAIYVANNSHFRPYHPRGGAPYTAMSMHDLGKTVRKAIDEITENEITIIFGRELVSGAKFEGGKGVGRAVPAKEIFQYIQQLRQYPIRVVDAPDYRDYESGAASPIHGEMAIMDYLQHHPDGQALMTERQGKLAEIAPSQPAGAKRVMWIGGTRVDCEMCHGHFSDINMNSRIGKNYVVSSEQQGSLFKGTEGGTRLSDKADAPQGTTTKIVLKIRPDGSEEAAPEIPPG